jgi:hypothetical protein
MMPHCILFELANFHGAHRHVFTVEPNLSASDDSVFSNKTSSIVILEGNGEFFSDADFKTKIGNTLEPGVYPFVANIGIKNNAISSLRPVR